jgi:glutathione S-transferase
MGFNNLTKEDASIISEKALLNFENIFLKKKFIASDEKVTIADLALAWHFNNLQYYGLEFTPRVKE